MKFTALLLHLAGTHPEQFDGRPFHERHRRVMLGALVLGSATVASLMLAAALLRVYPDSAWRWLLAPAGAALYFAVLAAVDSLFVSSNESVSTKAAAARILLSLIVTAFSSLTLDAAIAGDRLEAEIESRRADANQAIQRKHEASHGLAEKGHELLATSSAVREIEQALQADPPTPLFQAAAQRLESAQQSQQSLGNALEPRLQELRAELAAATQEAAASPEPVAAARVAQLRSQRETIERRLREAQRGLTAAQLDVETQRREWRAQQALALQSARSAQQQSRGRLEAARASAGRETERSHEINQRAFRPNLVEQMAAFWSLAARERMFLVLGLAAWAGALALELMAILVKLMLKPDGHDLKRRTQAQREVREAELEAEARAALTSADLACAERARVATGALLESLRHRETAARAAGQTGIQAFVDMQTQRQHLGDPRIAAGMDRRFALLQEAVDADLQAALATSGQRDEAADGAVADGVDSSPVPPSPAPASAPAGVSDDVIRL